MAFQPGPDNGSIKKEGGYLSDIYTAERFQIVNNIPVILRHEEVEGLNRLYKKRYDWIAYIYAFKDETFDVVFHIGGINFFSKKEDAVLEMIRVAKPGARIYIGDETAKLLEEQPSIFSRYYHKPDPEIYGLPLKYIPDSMLDVVTHEV